ncbi:MAG: DUF1501 domain-containing protein [Betaproteobacteria bacterium]
MKRRQFLQLVSAAGIAASSGRPDLAFAATPAARADYRRLLVLIELKGGNDGLNTLIPYADSNYYALRPKLAIPKDQVLQLDERFGLHPEMAALLPLWRDKQLAVVRGVGYPDPNLSHFRSIEIWDTASSSNEYLQSGWLTRAFSSTPTPKSFAADGVIVGSNDLGPLLGGGTRAIALNNTEQFLRQARLAAPQGQASNPALSHILKVEADIQQAALNLDTRHEFTTEFPRGAFGNSVRTACQVVANRAGVAVVRVTLGGFDTHQNQLPVQARLLMDLAEGIAAFRSALTELGRWDSTLLMTYAEFGRRPQENMSGGTDHGTASVHFATGGRVAGGFHGEQPSLAQLDGQGNTAFGLDFRSLYATALERWWEMPSKGLLGGQFAALDLIRA